MYSTHENHLKVTTMTISPAFYRSVAVCSIVSAITTLGLIYLPEFYQPV